jgi:hypothetical protein
MTSTKRFQIEQVVYVPSTNKKQKHISLSAMKRRTKEVESFLSKKYGGYTAVTGTGGYTLKKGKLVTEGVTKVTGFTTKARYKKLKPLLKKQLVAWGNKWGQESMGLEIEGDLFYIKNGKKKLKIRRRKRK